MKTLTFKTNINCASCVRSVSQFMDEVQGLSSWEVDTTNENKWLTAKGEDLSSEAVIEKVKEAGFDISASN